MIGDVDAVRKQQVDSVFAINGGDGDFAYGITAVFSGRQQKINVRNRGRALDSCVSAQFVQRAVRDGFGNQSALQSLIDADGRSVDDGCFPNELQASERSGAAGQTDFRIRGAQSRHARRV